MCLQMKVGEHKASLTEKGAIPPALSVTVTTKKIPKEKQRGRPELARGGVGKKRKKLCPKEELQCEGDGSLD